MRRTLDGVSIYEIPVHQPCSRCCTVSIAERPLTCKCKQSAPANVVKRILAYRHWSFEASGLLDQIKRLQYQRALLTGHSAGITRKGTFSRWHIRCGIGPHSREYILQALARLVKRLPTKLAHLPPSRHHTHQLARLVLCPAPWPATSSRTHQLLQLLCEHPLSSHNRLIIAARARIRCRSLAERLLSPTTTPLYSYHQDLHSRSPGVYV